MFILYFVSDLDQKHESDYCLAINQELIFGIPTGLSILCFIFTWIF